MEASGGGCDVDVTIGKVVVMIDAIGEEEVERPVAVIGEMAAAIGEAVAMVGGVVVTVGGVVVTAGGVVATVGGVVVMMGGVVATVGGVVVMMGGVVVRMGEMIVEMGEGAGVTGSETGSERRGGDGAIGSTDCAPSPPVAPWSVARLEVLEAMEEVLSLL